MATVTLLLKANKVDEKGEMPLYLRIIKNRKAKFISIGVKVHPDLWDSTNHRVKKKFPNSAKTNAFIAKKVAEAEGVSVELETSKKSISSNKIKEAILGKTSTSLLAYMDCYIAGLFRDGKIGTYKRVKSVTFKLKKFLNNKDISFDEFDLPFLKRYERYLIDELNNKTNTVHSNLKTFRKIFNDAIREDLIEPNQNPFLRFKLSLEKTTKEFLSEDEIETIENLDINESTVMFHHRNMYIFACYAGGIRISDILHLRWVNFDGSHIRIVMQKTKESIVVKLPSKALEILDFYKGLNNDKNENDFIFPILKNDIDYSNPIVLFKAISSSTAHANKNLKIIAQKAEISKSISFHTSRHTFATRALRKGMRIEYVSKLLGHGSIKTTQIYTKIVNAELDNAMDIFN